MTTTVITYSTLSLTQQVLERQQTHALDIAGYIPANADISGSTGWLLSPLDPLSQAACTAGAKAADVLGGIDRLAAGAVGDVSVDFARSDTDVKGEFTRILSRLGASGPAASYPELSGPSLGPAGSNAGSGYGDVASNYVQKYEAAGQSVSDGVKDVESLIHQVKDGAPTSVTELVDASSYLVAPQAPDNPVQNLRWNAGVLLGSIDWVASKFIGYSILQKCVYGPLAGDWQGVYKAAEAWSHAGDAMMAMAKNHAGLVDSTPSGWEGLSGDAFRVMMTALTKGCLELNVAYGLAASLVKKISTVVKVACMGIGAALKAIADKLLKMAAEAAEPVIGWAIGAVTAYSDVQDVVKNVRRIYSIFELIASAVQDFAAAKASITDKLDLIVDLSQGAGASV